MARTKSKYNMGQEVEVGKPDLPARPPVRPVPKVTCAECGRQMNRLTHTHLEQKHDGMTLEQYIEKWGIEASKPQVNGVSYTWMTGGPKNTALNDEVYATIMEMAEKGYPKTTIAKTVGISYTTLLNWINWGAPDDVDKYGNHIHPEIYVKFYQDYMEAEAKSEILAVDALRDAGRNDWRAAVEFLARRFPENWRPESRTHVEVSGQVEHKQVRDLEVDKLLEDPELAAMACEVLERLSGGDRKVIEAGPDDVEEVEEDEPS